MTKEYKRRDFMVLSATAFAGIGSMFMLAPCVLSMAPSSSVRAASTVTIDLRDISPGEEKTIQWRGKPVFIKHRTTEEIENKDSILPLKRLQDPVHSESRYKNPMWIIVLGICTHLGCVPIIAKEGGLGYDGYSGWYCPCHGSHYDEFGRIVKGPAPRNLEVPPYYFVDDDHVLIGLDSPES
ncbi:MAG: ubiquinol-cytochrome c reductase, iron-sulfur subunit [Candidatus Xenolissoclinum pacificiensis L6]|uniref:Ubiquinol-cytochrome c reductase iron-sulfur subunit n=1 Tax=Candidatus Xenolissoclinum pacificiensis L6 TaxID=1401685 RepID=W2V184_9RICK|nr:MAG: ubiquinol-cytochrome c reductase, iron-sulfur subunit [Candidatus Xenolissoclinum pacificiensis L6]